MYDEPSRARSAAKRPMSAHKKSRATLTAPLMTTIDDELLRRWERIAGEKLRD